MPTSEGTKYYQLRRSCCLELNITLCLEHLAHRLQEGWRLDKDRGVDNKPCFDCESGQNHVG